LRIQIVLAGFATAAMLLTGCSGPSAVTEEESTTSATQEAEATQTQDAIAVEEGLFTVDVTLPASLVQDTTDDDIAQTVEEQGYDSFIRNEDGSVTYRMSKAKRDSELKEYATTIDESFKETMVSEPYIKSISHNDKFNAFTIEVDKTAFESAFSFVGFGIAISASFYQYFDGVQDPKVTIDYKDVSSGEVFDSVTYPDDMNN
jgi:hypothetical protein